MYRLKEKTFRNFLIYIIFIAFIFYEFIKSHKLQITFAYNIL